MSHPIKDHLSYFMLIISFMSLSRSKRLTKAKVLYTFPQLGFRRQPTFMTPSISFVRSIFKSRASLNDVQPFPFKLAENFGCDRFR